MSEYLSSQRSAVPVLPQDALQWLFHQLWQKRTIRAPQFRFNIAETVIMHKGKPLAWFMSTPTGEIVKKSSQHLQIEKIVADLGTRQAALPGAPTVTTYTLRPQRNPKNGSERTAICVGNLEGENLQRYLTKGVHQDGYPTLVQAYQPGSPGDQQNKVCAVKLAQGSVQMHLVTNINSLQNTNLSLKERMMTVEKEAVGELSSQMKIRADTQLSIKLRKAIKDIIKHLSSVADVTVTAANFYFQAGDIEDDNSKVTLLFATNIVTEPEVPVLNDSLGFVLTGHEHAVETEQPEEEEQESPQEAYNLPATNHELPPQPSRHLSEGADRVQDSQRLGTEAENKMYDANVSTNSFMRETNASVPNNQFDSASPLARDYLQQLYQVEQGCCSQCSGPLPDDIELNGLNAAIVIRIHDYFERHPAGLLLLPATSSLQSTFYEDMYKQIQAQQTTVPLMLQLIYDLQSDEDYAQLRTESRFLYQEFKLCDDCYDTVKKMQIYQSNEQSRQQLPAQNASTAIPPGSDRYQNTPRRLTPLVQPPVVPQGMANKAVMSVQKQKTASGTGGSTVNSLIQPQDKTRIQNDLINYKIDALKERDAAFTASLKQLQQMNQAMHPQPKQFGGSLRVRTAGQRVRAGTMASNENLLGELAEQVYTTQGFSKEQILPTQAFGKSGGSKASLNKRSKKGSLKVISEAAVVKRMRLSQKLQVEKQFNNWKEQGYNQVSSPSGFPIQFNPQLDQASTFPKSVLDRKKCRSKMALQGQQSPLRKPKKTRAISATPAQMRERIAQQLFRDKSSQVQTDYIIKRHRPALNRPKSGGRNNQWIEQTSPQGSLRDAEKIYHNPSYARTLQETKHSGKIIHHNRDSLNIITSQVLTDKAVVKKRIAALKRPTSGSTNNNKTKSSKAARAAPGFLDQQLVHSNSHAASTSAYFNNDPRVETNSAAVRSSALTSEHLMQIQEQKKIAEQLQKLNEDTVKTLKQVEKNAEGIMTQLKDIRSESKECLQASSDAASMMVAARSGVIMLQNKPQSDSEWIDLSQDLNTIVSKQGASIPEMTDSREKMYPEAPIEQNTLSDTAINQPHQQLISEKDYEIQSHHVETAAFKGVSQHESNRSLAVGHVSLHSSRNNKQAQSQAQLSSKEQSQADGTMKLDRAINEEQQHASQPFFTETLNSKKNEANAEKSSQERQSGPKTENNAPVNQDYTKQLNTLSEADADQDCTVMRNTPAIIVGHKSLNQAENMSLETSVQMFKRQITEKEPTTRTDSTWIVNKEPQRWECSSGSQIIVSESHEVNASQNFQKKKLEIITENQIHRSQAEIPIHNEPLPEVAYGMTPIHEPHAANPMTPTPDQDSQANPLSEPEFAGAPPSSGRATSQFTAPPKTEQQAKPPLDYSAQEPLAKVIEEPQQCHIDPEYFPPEVDDLEPAMKDPFGSQLMTENAEISDNVSIDSMIIRSRSKVQSRNLNRSNTNQDESKTMALKRGVTPTGSDLVTEKPEQQVQSLTRREENLYRSQETILAEVLMKNIKQSQTSIGVTSIASAQVLKNNEPLVADLVQDYLQWIYDDAIKKNARDEQGEQTVLLEHDLDQFLNLVYQDAINSNKVALIRQDSRVSGLSVFLGGIYGDAIDQNDAQSLRRIESQMRNLDIFLDQIYEDAQLCECPPEEVEADEHEFVIQIENQGDQSLPALDSSIEQQRETGDMVQYRAASALDVQQVDENNLSSSLVRQAENCRSSASIQVTKTISEAGKVHLKAEVVEHLSTTEQQVDNMDHPYGLTVHNSMVALTSQSSRENLYKSTKLLNVESPKQSMDQFAHTEHGMRIHTSQPAASQNETNQSQTATEIKAVEFCVQEKSSGEVNQDYAEYDLPLQMTMKTEKVDRSANVTPVIEEDENQVAALKDVLRKSGESPSVRNFTQHVSTVQEVEEPDSRRESQGHGESDKHPIDEVKDEEEVQKTYTDEESREMIAAWERHAINKIELQQKPPSEKRPDSDYAPREEAPDKSEGEDQRYQISDHEPYQEAPDKSQGEGQHSQKSRSKPIYIAQEKPESQGQVSQDATNEPAQVSQEKQTNQEQEEEVQMNPVTSSKQSNRYDESNAEINYEFEKEEVAQQAEEKSSPQLEAQDDQNDEILGDTDQEKDGRVSPIVIKDNDKTIDSIQEASHERNSIEVNQVKLEDSSWENPLGVSAHDKSDGEYDHMNDSQQSSPELEKTADYGYFVADEDRPGYQTILNRLEDLVNRSEKQQRCKCAHDKSKAMIDLLQRLAREGKLEMLARGSLSPQDLN